MIKRERESGEIIFIWELKDKIVLKMYKNIKTIVYHYDGMIIRL